MTDSADFQYSEAIDVQQILATIGEPTRFRILQLLATGPRTVGDVTAHLGALQPQTTKHLQALESVGIIRVHRLGRRRIARLDRDTLAQLAGFFENLHEVDPDDSELDNYERSIATEMARPPGKDGARVLRFARTLSASATTVWEAWTNPARAVEWWAPRHFTVRAFEISPAPGSPIRIVLREGDGAEYESRGRIESATPGSRLVFTLAPVDRGGQPLFRARHTLTIHGDESARISLVIQVSDLRPEAAPAIAGLEPGWRQLLDALNSALRA